MQSPKDIALEIIRREGGFVNDPSDPGGATKHGVTIHTLRAPGMTWFRLPLFCWSLYATSVILVLATPVLAITLLLVAGEPLFGIGVFDPRLGGDPLLFQHLFWFYSHPAVYIMILRIFSTYSCGMILINIVCIISSVMM